MHSEGALMKTRSRRMILNGVTIAVISLVSSTFAAGQLAPNRGGQGESAQKPLMSDEAFKDVQVLRGI